MASTETEQPGGKKAGASRGKAYTAPKGRPTTHGSDVGRRRLSATVEWFIAGILFIAVLAAIFYFGRDFSSGGGGGTGAPAPVVQLDDAAVVEILI